MSRRPEYPDAANALTMAGELHAIIGRLKRRLREEANLADFSSTQLSVLGKLDRDGSATVTALARAEGVRPQSMGETISTLKAAGLVSGTPDPTDGRKTVLSLSIACRKKIKAGRAAREGWLFRAIQSNLSPAEQKQLANSIELLKRLVDS